MQYVALLRGIMPMNPNMKSGKLKEAFESMGFSDVKTVIASGNVIFESPETNILKLEEHIEKALPKLLQFSSSTIVVSKEELETLAKKDPFKGIPDTKENYLVVTFLKGGKTIATVITLGEDRTPDLMRRLEKEHGKQITTRTWKTVHRILKAFNT